MSVTGSIRRSSGPHGTDLRSPAIFTGGRIGGNEQVAEGALQEAQARLRQTREAAELEARVSQSDLGQAEATLRSVTSTVEQATRGYNIAGIRFKEGISTQLELSDSRLQLEQALSNKARAARNYQVARVKLALLRDLPLSQGGSAAAQQAAAAAQQGSSMQSQQSSTGSGQPSQSSGAQGGAVPGVTTSATGNY